MDPGRCSFKHDGTATTLKMREGNSWGSSNSAELKLRAPANRLGSNRLGGRVRWKRSAPANITALVPSTLSVLKAFLLVLAAHHLWLYFVEIVTWQEGCYPATAVVSRLSVLRYNRLPYCSRLPVIISRGVSDHSIILAGAKFERTLSAVEISHRPSCNYFALEICSGPSLRRMSRILMRKGSESCSQNIGVEIGVLCRRAIRCCQAVESELAAGFQVKSPARFLFVDAVSFSLFPRVVSRLGEGLSSRGRVSGEQCSVPSLPSAVFQLGPSTDVAKPRRVADSVKSQEDYMSICRSSEEDSRRGFDSPDPANLVAEPFHIRRCGSLVLVSRKTSHPRRLCAAVLPHRTLPHLVEFHGNRADHPEEMNEITRFVENHLATRFLRLEVYSNPPNLALLQHFDVKNRCGGLPFYVNLLTLKTICGSTTLDNMLSWAQGLPSLSHCPPAPREIDFRAAKRRTGFSARIWRKLDNVREAGQRRMAKRLEDELRRSHYGKVESDTTRGES